MSTLRASFTFHPNLPRTNQVQLFPHYAIKQTHRENSSGRVDTAHAPLVYLTDTLHAYTYLVSGPELDLQFLLAFLKCVPLQNAHSCVQYTHIHFLSLTLHTTIAITYVAVENRNQNLRNM